MRIQAYKGLSNLSILNSQSGVGERLIRSPIMAKNSSRWRNGLQITGLILAAALLAAAILVAVRQVDWTVLRHASPWQLGALGAAAAGNVVLTAALFWAVTRSFDARPGVGLGRMMALIAVSNVLNYLPLIRAGLLGRAAYLKARHELPLRQSVVILAVVLVLAVVVLGAAAAVLLSLPGGWRWLALVAVMVALTAATEPVARRLLRRRVVGWGWWVPLRIADTLISALRLWLAFAVMGVPIGYADAVVIGAAGLLVRLIGVTPNGLGLSEWAVAGLSTLLTPATTAAGAAAALLDRAVEIVVMSTAGTIGAWFLKR